MDKAKKSRIDPLWVETLKIYWQEMLPKKHYAIAIIVGVLVWTALDLIKPLFSKVMFDYMQQHLQNGRSSQNAIWFAFAVYVALAFIRNLSLRFVEKKNNYFQPKMMANLLVRCYSYLLGHSQQFFTNNVTGGLQNKTNKFVGSFEVIADQITFDLLRSVILLTMLSAISFYYNFTFGLMIFVWLVIYLIFSYKFALFKYPFDKAQAEQQTAVNIKMSDVYTNSSLVRAFAMQKKEAQIFSDMANDLFVKRKKCWDLGWIAAIVQSSLIQILEGVTIAYAIWLFLQNFFTIGDVVFVTLYLNRITDNTWSISRNIRQIIEKMADASEMAEKLIEPHSITDQADAKPLRISTTGIKFNNVSFSYKSGQKVLKNVSFAIPSGKMVALVGPSGAGKTTIAKLLCREEEVDEGFIEIDSQNIKDVTLESLRSNIAVVSQESNLFSRSLLFNIGYGPESKNKDQIVKAAYDAGLESFINSLPNKFETKVGDRGYKLSGGQRQRVSIARGLIGNKPILILDEATSSLDSQTESEIRQAIQNVLIGKTTLVIAHRLSTIMMADNIIVIDEGKIVDQGTHEDLISRDGLYKNLWNAQVNGFISEHSHAALNAQ